MWHVHVTEPVSAGTGRHHKGLPQCPLRRILLLLTAYRLGLKRVSPPPVVRYLTSGGTCGYVAGSSTSKSRKPPA
jgi:hypothetical protein